MVGVLIAAHGGFAEGILSGAELLVGKQEQVETVGLYHGDGIDAFSDKICAALDKLDTGEGVYVFVDILGGTPSNTVLRHMAGRNIKGFAGVNMALLVQTLLMRGMFSGDELYEAVLEATETPISYLHEVYAQMVNTEVEEDEI